MIRFQFLLLGLIGFSSAQASQFDDFKAACVAAGQVSDASCACQTGLAKDSLGEKEIGIVIAGMSGKREDYIGAINKLTADEAKVFYDKMQILSNKAQATCNAPQ